MQILNQEILDKIESLINEIRPAIQNHAGDISFIEFKDNTVFLKFHGACTNCPMSFYTLKMGIEKHFKDNISQDINVVSIE